MKMVPIIGLEIHVQLNTKSKMFCACPNVDDGAPPNTAICPVCTGQPGALPALNSSALEKGVLAGLVLGCNIPDRSAFDRKNYFYPDLPKGYQISQFGLPVALGGAVELEIPTDEALPQRQNVRIGITRAHLEEDAAKNFHAPQGVDGRPATLVDYNRGGTPLIEIVTEPDFRSSAEAKYFLQELRAMMRTAKVSNADMEKGQMRCDVNISLLEVDDQGFPISAKLNARTEIKNLNSFRAVERAIEYEIKRQQGLYEAGTPPVESTRGWDENQDKTLEQRSKETSADYRYFPEPDLPPQDLTKARESVSSRLPELPSAKRQRLKEEYGFTSPIASLLVTNEWDEYAEQIMGELAAWLEASDDEHRSGGDVLRERRVEMSRLVGGWLTSKLAGILAERNLTIKQANITPENFAEFIRLLDKAEINSANGQKLLLFMHETGGDPSDLMETHNLGQSVSNDELLGVVERALQANPDQVEAIRAGKTQLIKWFVGLIMRETEGRANPQQAEEEIKKQIGV